MTCLTDPIVVTAFAAAPLPAIPEAAQSSTMLRGRLVCTFPLRYVSMH